MVFNKNFYNLIILSFLLATCSGCSTNQLPELFPPYSTPVNQALADSGKNRPQIENFLNSFRDNPEKRQAAQFLVANLPPGDRVSLSDKLLTENIEYAFLARENTPWGQDVSWTNFLHYVLPHRVSQEQAVEWRKLFYNELQPVVSQCKTAEEAILAVNRWCFSKTGFKSTQRWDQNPLMTINRGWGRCEEAVILTVCALRSIGIPARQAMVPAWQHSDDNHTWTEVMVNGKWHYIESANPDYGLDHAWFTGSARKAPLVISYAYGRVDNPQSPIMGYRFGCTQINTTARYAPASRTQILVTDNTGTPLANTKVYISVFNYASFRPVASKTTDLNGKTDILLGPGSVLISAANGNNTAYTASTWIPGEQEKRENVELKLSAGNLPEGNILFRFAYNDKQAATAPPKNSEGAKKAEFDSLRKKRIDKLAEMSKKAKRVAPVISETISGAGLNVPQLLNALHLCPEKYKASLIRSIKDMPVADLVKITHEDLISNVVLAETAREEARNAGLEYDDKIFDSFVLSPRIMYEQLRPWREKLHSRFKLETNVPYTKRIEDLANFTDFLKRPRAAPSVAALILWGYLIPVQFRQMQKHVFLPQQH